MKSKVAELGKLITNASHVVVLTGAGMDTESNIPDFRSKHGLWRSVDPRIVASIDTMEENYELFHEFNRLQLELLDKCKPHRGHYILAELEKRGLVHAIATQNVTGFHLLAGSKKVFELHGNLRTFRCNYCDRPAEPEDFLHKKSCAYCGKQVLRPNVVLFGENLPEEAWANTLTEVQQSDLLIIIGTSLTVSPVNQIPGLARGQTVYINMEEAGIKGYDFDLFIQGKAGEVLEELMNTI